LDLNQYQEIKRFFILLSIHAAIMKIKIKRFDPTTIKKDAVVLLIGKRGSGKTTLMKDIMYHVRDKLDFGIAMSPTEDTTESLSSFIPPTCIYNTYSNVVLETLLETQRKQIKKGSHKNVFLLLDDCMYDKKIMAGTSTRELFMNGRHRKVFFMNSVQYMMDMPAALRSQVDYVFALKENIISSREKLWKYFFGMFQDFRDFNKVMNSCTEGYECIVVDNTTRSNEVSDCIYWYQASVSTPRFQMCRQIFWDLDAAYYEDRQDGDETEGPPSRKNPKNIRVEKQDTYGIPLLDPKE
jgi:energy-coupling factor transporter ATP-binding protein EcfA2